MPPKDSAHNSAGGPAPDARLITASYQVFRLLLVCYPRSFRDAFGHDMAVVFRDTSRAVYQRGGSGALLGLWRMALPDLLIAAAQERMKEGMQMSRQGLARFAALSLLVVGAAQVLFALIRVAFYTDYAAIYIASNGNPFYPAAMQYPWAGWGAISLFLSPTTLVFLLIGVVGLHRLSSHRLGTLGRIGIAVVVLGLAIEVGGGAIASAATWGDLSLCIDPRFCSITGTKAILVEQAYIGGLMGVAVAGIGFVLYGLAMTRSRLLPRGNILLVLLGVGHVQPLVILVTMVLRRQYDLRWIYANLAIGLESLVVAILIILIGRTLLRASPVVAAA